ncbi:27301_t:CDS:2, partial [Gigaspora margarita]
NITNDVTDSIETSSKAYLLCIPFLTWESTFIPGRSDCKSNLGGKSSQKGSNIKIIIGCTIAFGSNARSPVLSSPVEQHQEQEQPN